MKNIPEIKFLFITVAEVFALPAKEV